MIGAFGRVACLVGVAVLLVLASSWPNALVIALFFVVWTVYAFVSGIVAVPYNDIVARSVPSAQRSRLLAIRFFGGGLLALGVAASAHRILGILPSLTGYATVVLLGSALLFISAISFVSAGEPPAPPTPSPTASFNRFIRGGIDVFLFDRRFQLFLFVQWLGGAVAMAFPFYILQVISSEGSATNVAFLLGVQTAGALLSNPLWGWWGDIRGKASLLEIVATLSIIPPLLTLAWITSGGRWADAALPWFAVVFALLGAMGNGRTIAQLGYLMEISPDDRRPAYSGYFNALVAPAALLPLAGAFVAEAASFATLFATSMVAGVLQFLLARRLRSITMEDRSITRLSWWLARIRYRLHGIRLNGQPEDEIWYFAFGTNMHDSAFRERRGMRPIRWRAGRVQGYRLRFNLEGRPRGKAAPANLARDPEAEVWGVLYCITRADLLHLDTTEGVPGRRYRHLWIDAEDIDGRKEKDGNPSLRYITLLREGARAHGLPEQYLRFLDSVKHAE